MQTTNQPMETVIAEIAEILLTSVFEKQIAIRDLADQLAHEYDDIKDGDRSKAVAIRDMADKQKEHLNELENKLDSIEFDTPQSIETESEPMGTTGTEDDAYDRLTLKFERLGTLLYNLNDPVSNMTKKEAAVFTNMAVEIFEAATEDARELNDQSRENFPAEKIEKLVIERGDKLKSCIRTLEEIKAIADLLTVAAGNGDPLFFDETLEHIGCLITDRVKANMDKINAKPVVSELVQS